MDMATVTKHLKRWVQDCSLSNQRMSFEEELGMTDESEEDHVPIVDRTLELNSYISIPSHLEQCLDLKTGEIYYINLNSKMRVKEDPRTSATVSNNAVEFSGESDVTVFSEEDSSLYYESEESSSESSRENHKEEGEEQVFVVAGCKACYMYFMVPKLLKDCPKCSAQLLHFDSLHSASP
ncbi:hypothetical protein Bca4012_054890 [Brassica carinata]